MAEVTEIAWTKSTFNPWIGCTKVGPGCDYCYAEALDKRHRWGGATHWGPGVTRHRTSDAYWKQPLRWNAKQQELLRQGDAPPWYVFCASLADVFDNEAPPNARASLWHLIEETPSLSWLLVTKRIGNVSSMVPGHWKRNGFPPHVRLLITVVNQEEADRDIPKLLALNCKNGISYEPALGPIDWAQATNQAIFFRNENDPRRRVDWIICGGESSQGGHAARPFDIQWARDTISQCKDAGVACFVKQLGSNPILSSLVPGVEAQTILLKDRAGADPAEWPADINVREFP